MSDINSCIVVGRLTADPILKSLPSGTPVCEISLANNVYRKGAIDVGGQVTNKKVNFFNVTVFGKRAETLSQWTSKGSPVGVRGRLEHQTWEDKDTGKKRHTVKIIADEIQFFYSSKNKNQANPETEYSNRNMAGEPVSRFEPSPETETFDNPDTFSDAPEEDEVPF